MNAENTEVVDSGREALLPATQLAYDLAGYFKRFPEVIAVAHFGSLIGDINDQKSDLDIAVMMSKSLSPEEHAGIVRDHKAVSMGGSASMFDVRDFWTDPSSGILVDVSYLNKDRVEFELRSSLVYHSPLPVISTGLCRVIGESQILFDTDGWLASLQALTAQPYPEGLRRAIIEKNWSWLTHPHGFQEQMRICIARNDPTGWNQYAFIFTNSYFDVIYAVNRLYLPGAKQIVKFARRRCSIIPDNVGEIHEFLAAAPGPEAMAVVERLVAGLGKILPGEMASRAASNYDG